MFDVYDTVTGARVAARLGLWAALALCRDRNERDRTPGRYAVRSM